MLYDIFFLAYFSYRNGLRARVKGYNKWVWGFITGVSYLLAELIGALIVVFYFCRNVINFDALGDPAYNKTATLAIQQALGDNPLRVLTISMFGIGGYLLIRYLLERMKTRTPLTPEPPVIEEPTGGGQV
jgi:hypothetical protein